MHNLTRHEIRLQLLNNEYSPLPSAGKGVFIRGWSKATITDDWLAEYARSTRYMNTGIRCDTLIAVDIDVTDEAMADEVDDIVASTLGPTELCRIGQWPKRLLLYRAVGIGAYRSCRTGKYGEAGHMVELLAGNGRQFAAFGTHPGTQKPYYWDNPQATPLRVNYHDLPPARYDDAVALMDTLEQYFIDKGLERRSPKLTAQYAGSQVWDLHDGFECQVDGDIVLWGDLKPQLNAEGRFGNIRRENGEFGDSSAVHFYISAGNRQACAHDFVRDCTHWEKTIDPGMADALPELPPDQENLFTDPHLKGLLEHYCVMSDGTVRAIEEPQYAEKIANWRQARQHLSSPTGKTVKGIPEMDSTVKLWLRHPDAYRADIAELRPDYPTDLFIEKGPLTIYNTYREPVHTSPGGETDTVMAFIEHLIPGERERALFLDWHAIKLQHPDYRLHALVNVTPTFGTGRGTWSSIFSDLIGTQYTTTVKLSLLLGKGSQGQYTDFLADSLYIVVPEAFEENEERSKWATRHAAYEQIKLVCEPNSSRQRISQKYGKNTTIYVYASLFISTNHVDAMAIEPGDRRLIVLENGEVPLTQAPDNLYERIHEWRKDPANLAALYQYFLNRHVPLERYDPFGEPMMTDAKERMIESGQSGLDQAYEWVQRNAAGDILVYSQWRMLAMHTCQELGLEMPEPHKLDHALTAVLKKRARPCAGITGSRLKVFGGKHTAWIIRNSDTWRDESNTKVIRVEIQKSGDPMAAVSKMKKVD